MPLRRLARRVLLGAPPADPVENGWLVMGDHSYGKPFVVRLPGPMPTVMVGKYCSIATGAEFLPGGNHRPDWVSTYPFRHRFGLPGANADGHPSTKGPITVGNDVWIAGGAKVLSGVTIGDGAVVGAYAVVTRDVPPYAIVAGNPARVRRFRFEPDVVQALLDIRWWDWPDEKVTRFVPDLCSDDIRAFISKARSLDRPEPTTGT